MATSFAKFWNHPAGTKYIDCAWNKELIGFSGPKTVFFWGPMMKWCLVGAGLKDLSRPADKLSVSQNVGA